MNEEKKLCCKCKRRERAPGQGYCEICVKQYRREYYKKHREKLLAKGARYRAEVMSDPAAHEAMLEYQREYRATHKEQLSKYFKDRRKVAKAKEKRDAKAIDALKGLLAGAGRVVGYVDLNG